MKKNLSIVIPRYKEDTSLLTDILSSIRAQSNVKFEDIEIIIINDNPDDKIPEAWVNQISSIFGIDISVYDMEENGGSGLARQMGLDNATGKYIMFCDADDILYTTDSLSRLLGELICFPDTEFLSSEWFEEQYDKDHLTAIYIPHELENTWMHGKVFNRKFLINNHIRFHPSLRVHEDSYFLMCASSVAKQRRHLLSKTYIWRSKRDDSITRIDNAAYTYNSFPEFIRSICLAMKWLEDNEVELLDYTVVQLILYSFFVLQRRDWLEEAHKKYRDASIAMLKKEIAPYIDRYKNAKKEMIDQVYNEERNKSFQNQVESYSLTDWISMIS